MAATPSWCGATFPKWPTRSTSAIPAIRATPCCGARRSARGLRALSGYQGHGSVATPHNILITWAAIMEGGFQVNAQGRRFSNEALGYSEAAAEVLRQPGGIAFDIFDARIAGVARQFEDFRNAEKAGALIDGRHRSTRWRRASALPADALQSELNEIDAGRGKPDRFGRVFAADKQLAAPYCAIKVTGALFHTQGGLAIDSQARVLDAKGRPFPNLFAAGGAAVGVSGSQGVGLSVGQRPADRDGVRPHRGPIGGEAVRRISGGCAASRSPYRAATEDRHEPFRARPKARNRTTSPIVLPRSTGSASAANSIRSAAPRRARC